MKKYRNEPKTIGEIAVGVFSAVVVAACVAIGMATSIIVVYMLIRWF